MTALRAERKKPSSKGPSPRPSTTSSTTGPHSRVLDDSRICPSNSAAERAVGGIAVGRRNWTFCGCYNGGHRAAVMFSLIETFKLCEVDPKAWLADVLARIADHPVQQIEALLPWNWKAERVCAAAAQAD